MATVNYYGMVRRLIPVKTEQLDAANINELLGLIKQRHGDGAAAEIKRSFILVNGKNIALIKGYKTSIKVTDVIQIMTITGGG